MSEEADVRAAAEGLLAAYREGDVDAIARYWFPEGAAFWENGGLLAKFDEARLKAMVERGFKTEMQWRHLDVRVYGGTAVATGYLTGTITLPNGLAEQGSWRDSTVWVKQGGRWKIAHLHISKLLSASP